MEIDKIIVKFTRSDKNDFRETFPDEIIPKENNDREKGDTIKEINFKTPSFY